MAGRKITLWWAGARKLAGPTLSPFLRKLRDVPPRSQKHATYFYAVPYTIAHPALAGNLMAIVAAAVWIPLAALTGPPGVKLAVFDVDATPPLGWAMACSIRSSDSTK